MEVGHQSVECEADSHARRHHLAGGGSACKPRWQRHLFRCRMMVTWKFGKKERWDPRTDDALFFPLFHLFQAEVSYTTLEMSAHALASYR